MTTNSHDCYCAQVIRAAIVRFSFLSPPFLLLHSITRLLSRMSFSLVALWKQDTALNTYIFGLFLIGLPFTIFATYVTYQLQVVGFLIGTDANGQPCVDYCLVQFGQDKLDINSVLLYLNALGFGLGGVSAMFISAYADFWSELACGL